MQEVINFIVELVWQFGYMGIYIMMLLESSFFPFPSEVAMIPAGYLASKGEMNIYIAVFAGIFGSLSGALINYFLAIKYGRIFLLRYGKFVFFTEEKLQKVENYFVEHGAISTFIGRLIPVLRQYISFPAGLSKMDLKIFTIFTVLGAGIWVIILSYIGYTVGQNEAMVKEMIHSSLFYILGGLIVLSIFYYQFKKN
jgi:membrane protein DedA with SNARE-associated domain